MKKVFNKTKVFDEVNIDFGAWDKDEITKTVGFSGVAYRQGKAVGFTYFMEAYTTECFCVFNSADLEAVGLGYADEIAENAVLATVEKDVFLLDEFFPAKAFGCGSYEHIKTASGYCAFIYPSYDYAKNLPCDSMNLFERDDMESPVFYIDPLYFDLGVKTFLGAFYDVGAPASVADSLSEFFAENGTLLETSWECEGVEWEGEAREKFGGLYRSGLVVIVQNNEYKYIGVESLTIDGKKHLAFDEDDLHKLGLTAEIVQAAL